VAAILTRDLDFADIRRYPPEGYHGIVVLRLPDAAVAQDIVSVVKRFMLQAYSDSHAIEWSLDNVLLGSLIPQEDRAQLISDALRLSAEAKAG
jgi:hypothetical protein